MCPCLSLHEHVLPSPMRSPPTLHASRLPSSVPWRVGQARKCGVWRARRGVGVGMGGSGGEGGRLRSVVPRASAQPFGCHGMHAPSLRLFALSDSFSFPASYCYILYHRAPRRGRLRSRAFRPRPGPNARTHAGLQVRHCCRLAATRGSDRVARQQPVGVVPGLRRRMS